MPTAAAPALARLLAAIRPGETLVVVRLDLPARSLAHLLQVIETLITRGAAFRSLGDRVDTTKAPGHLFAPRDGAMARWRNTACRCCAVNALSCSGTTWPG